MAPTSLTALMSSPNGSNDSTILANGKTLPDISLGSLGSSFRSDDEEARKAMGARPVAKTPRLPTIDSPETSNSASITTPSPRHPISALVSLSPPMTVRRTSSHSALPDGIPGSHAPRRSRILRSSSSASGSDAEGATGAGYGDTTDDDDHGVLSALSINVTPGPGKKNGNGLAGSVAARAAYHGGVSKRQGRHSVAADVGNGPMTLRDQEQQIEQMKKDLFNLQLENHFLKDRLANTTDEHFRAMHNENVKLKLEVVNYAKEIKRLKKIILQQDKGLKDLQRQLDDLAENGKGRDGTAKELEGLWKEEKQRRKELEGTVQQLEEELAAGGGGEDKHKLRDQLDDVEASEKIWRERCEGLEDELEQAKMGQDDQAEEMARLRDEADRAVEEVEKLKEAGLNESVGLGKGREARMTQKIAELEQEVEHLRQQGHGEEVEEQLNEFQDKLAAAQLDLDRRDTEIDDLNRELDAKIREHEKELEQVASEWRDEVEEARAQVEELKDVLESREQDLKDIRELLIEREEEVAIANERVAELEANQNETHDRLEETLKNIERDNAEKEGDLIAANREVESLGQRVYELEEAIEEFRARESDLNADLRSADEAFENAKTHYENLVSALKEARKKLQEERDEALAAAKREEEGRKEDKRERLQREERHKRLMEDREQINTRLQAELEAARDRVAQRDQDLASVQNALRSLEDERRKIGDEHTSDRFSLELEMERAKRDLASAEDELEQARKDLSRRDAEVAQMLDRQRDLENRLSSERQGRLNLSDKLDAVAKSSKQHERDARQLRERLDELEPLLTETQQERFQIQKQSEQQRQERSELLLRVFKDVNKFLGTEDHSTPANFGVFRDTLLHRLRSLNHVRSDFEKRVKETEASVDHRMAGLKKQIEQKWRALDDFESSVKKLEVTRMQWRSKFAMKDAELEAVKARNTDLAKQISSLQALSSSEGHQSSSQVRSLTERAANAEKRCTHLSSQIAQLEAKLAEIQARSGQAENKWEARVKEYENRLRIAGEKIKTEKQGGKERAVQLEAQVRELERQVESAKRRNVRAEGVVASAAHLMPSARQ